ncbi:hypothetical protein Q3G72_003139 [Acer saccharum]|nr:hypothetical protein Q3G72_003139 [Acer saccharum]
MSILASLSLFPDSLELLFRCRLRFSCNALSVLRLPARIRILSLPHLTSSVLRFPARIRILSSSHLFRLRLMQHSPFISCTSSDCRDIKSRGFNICCISCTSSDCRDIWSSNFNICCNYQHNRDCVVTCKIARALKAKLSNYAEDVENTMSLTYDTLVGCAHAPCILY